MRTIWKFPLKSAVVQYLEMPRNAKPLSIMMQEGRPCLWAEVEPKEALETRALYIVGTGGAVQDEASSYISTVLFEHEGLVFHFYLGTS